MVLLELRRDSRVTLMRIKSQDYHSFLEGMQNGMATFKDTVVVSNKAKCNLII